MAAEGVPPVPGGLSGADPGKVVEFAGGSQLVDHVVYGKPPFIFSVSDYAPGECAGGINYIEVVQVLRILNLGIVGVRRELCLESFLRRAEEHARIRPEVGLCKQQAPILAYIRIYGHEGEASVRLGNVAGIHLVVQALERSTVSVVFRSTGIGHKHIVRLREIEFRNLVFYLAAALALGHEAVGDAVIVCPEFQRITSFHLESQEVVIGVKLRLAVEGGDDMFGLRALDGPLHTGIVAESDAVLDEGDTPWPHYLMSVHGKRPFGCPAGIYGK